MVVTRSWLWIAVSLLVVVVLFSSSVVAQERDMEMGIDQLHRNMMSQLAGIWSGLVSGLADDPEFLGTAEGEGLVSRQESLMEIRWMMLEGMRGPEPEGGAMGAAGTFEFVSWIELDRTYWALDTRTGQMHPRECPEPPEHDEMDGE